jgi:hypothetical protein
VKLVQQEQELQVQPAQQVHLEQQVKLVQQEQELQVQPAQQVPKEQLVKAY